ncbi:periplasmic chaperone for outer membrane proteins SurA [Tahibacter aquaticus]|uniref:Chaperone SurA n=1 Tax=Tahibacter aquaticus TaxID=520092 RepID=A0A4R6YPM0_9GAMM|nr:peptidylprolyl isomerase [Tahibacter aquaticus]TDR39758.1 periplasmic chaperone for outer membrane proteins SurA [Tahibacter aquaticus]
MNKPALAFALLITLFSAAAPAQFLAPPAAQTPNPAAQQPVRDDGSLDRIVAIVDEDVVLQSELDRAVTQVLAQYQRNPQQLPPRNILERQVLDRLIMTRLQVAKASQTGVRIGDVEIEQAIGNIARSNKMDVDQLRTAIARDGLSYEEFRRNLRDELTTQRLRQRVAQSAQVSDAEIDIMLASNSLKTGEVRLSHILVGVPDGASAEQISAAREKAEKVRRDIESTGDFTAVAMRSSDAGDALEGGDLGWRRYDQVPEVFSDLLQGMSVGQVSQAVRGPSGFHILKLVEKREQGTQMVTEFHAQHMMIKVTELVGEAEAEKKIKDLRRRVESGEDFAALAKANSEDNTSANAGGDMGWFPIDTYGPQVGEVISQLKDGELSQPFRSNVGFHFVKRLGMRELDRTADARRAQAREAIQQRKAEDEYENLMRQLKSEAYIEYRLAGFDTKGEPKTGS